MTISAVDRTASHNFLSQGAVLPSPQSMGERESKATLGSIWTWPSSFASSVLAWNILNLLNISGSTAAIRKISWNWCEGDWVVFFQ